MTHREAERLMGDAPTARELLALVCGEYLGAGIHREVYEYAPNPEFVIKLETASASFANAREWLIWERVSQWSCKTQDWFAPCFRISPRGDWLIQARTMPLNGENMPERVPDVLNDLKTDNWGRLNGRVVCHDYADALIVEKGITKRMKKADWR